MFIDKENFEELSEQPLGYWEEMSYMIAAVKDQELNLIDGIFERVEVIENIEIKEKRDLTENEPGYIKLVYEDEEYEVGFYPSEFHLPEVYLNTSYYFSSSEVESIRKATNALTVFMKFNKNPKKAHHLQLKLIEAMVPDLIVLMDESAEKIFPSAWVKMRVKSTIVSSAKDLFTVHAVSSEDGKVWLHTHGLCRCGTTELEVLESDVENYKNHYNLLATFASYLLDKIDEFDVEKESAYIGLLINGQPVVATCVSWTKALKEYKKLSLGNVEDRQEGHNSKTSVIFMYKSENDERYKKYTKVSDYNELWGDNPIFFISSEETDRMKALALEYFDLMKEASKNEENHVILKLGIPFGNDGELEHIWFELVEFNGDKFRAKLLQEPYNVQELQEGDEAWFTIDSVTDWTVYTPKFQINPDNVYLFEI